MKHNAYEKIPETPVPHHNGVQLLVEKRRVTDSVEDIERSRRLQKSVDWESAVYFGQYNTKSIKLNT